MRRALMIAAILALAALPCVTGCRPRYVELDGRGAVVKSNRLGWYHKKVVTKQAPETLVADDGTICRVAPDRFRSTAAGALVYCNWQ